MQASPKERRTFRRLGYDELYNIAETKLIEALNADANKINAMLAAGRAMGDDE